MSGRQRGALDLFARKTLIFFAIAIGLALLWSVRRVLILLFIAGVLASGISPAVHRVRVWSRHYLHVRIRRGTAVLLVYVPFLVAVALGAVFGLPLLAAESRDMGEKLPVLIEQRILQPLGKYLPIQEVREVLFSETREVELFGYLRGAVSVIASVVVVLVLIVYMMIDAERLRNLFLLFWPAEERGRKRRMILRMSRRMSSWLGGQLLLAGIVGGATLVALLLLRIPYALPLALVAAVGEMIPVLGPILGAVPALIVTLFFAPDKFWIVLIVAIVIQQLENYLLVPRIMGEKVLVPPLAIFVAFLMGGTLLGIVGALMAIPASAIVHVAFEEAFVLRRERRQDRTRPGTLGGADAGERVPPE